MPYKPLKSFLIRVSYSGSPNYEGGIRTNAASWMVNYFLNVLPNQTIDRGDLEVYNVNRYEYGKYKDLTASSAME